jgi:eukaryotic-like serine/threonine-protein kinase
VVGKSPKSKAEPAAHTMLSPAPPEYGTEYVRVDAARTASIAGELASGRERGTRSSERVLLGTSALEPALKHIDDEILEYLGRQLPEADLARIDAHLDTCTECRDLMHHVVQGMAQSAQTDEDELADSSAAFQPGSVINSRYRIRSFVGRGGMGEVYEAFDQLMDRRIALKTVLCTVAERPRAARQLKEEVRNAQRVGHPHVCRINDLQEHQQDGFGPPLPFLTMEFIDGERLGHRLLEGPLPLADVRRIAVQLLAGLEAAHERGVLHLDFKSDNVMLRRNAAMPDAVIMDFGLSRIQGQQSRMRTSERRQFAGTLPYMSVEQLECRDDLGPPTDVYAFGIVLYEMLTRTLPFEGDSLGAVLLKQLKERATPPSRHVPGLAPALDRFVLKCLHSNPGSRYANAGQALRALRAIGPWSQPKGLARHWKTAVSVGLGAGLLALIATWALRRTSAPSELGAAPQLQPRLEQHTQALDPAPLPAAPIAALPAPTAPAPAEPGSAAPLAPLVQAPALAPVAGTRAAAPVAPPTQRRRAPSASEVRAASSVPAAPSPGEREPSSAALPVEPKAEPPIPLADDASWTPAKVPKRLGVPTASPAAGTQ